MRPTSRGLFYRPRLIQSFLVLFFFIAYLFLYLEATTLALARSPAINSLSKKFIPPFKNFIPGFSYMGFVLPLSVALVALFLIIWDSSWRTLNIRRWITQDKYWLIGFFLSVGFWYLIPGFASGGHTDFPLAILICIHVGWHLNHKQTKRTILISLILGFGIGFASDMQSQTFFTGIFGGWGLIDGDLLGTVALPLATLTTLALMGVRRNRKYIVLGVVKNRFAV